MKPNLEELAGRVRVLEAKQEQTEALRSLSAILNRDKDKPQPHFESGGIVRRDAYYEGKKHYSFIMKRKDELSNLKPKYCLVSQKTGHELYRYIDADTFLGEKWNGVFEYITDLKLIVSGDVSDCQIIVI